MRRMYAANVIRWLSARIQKSDLKIRPIWQKRAGLGSSPRTVLHELRAIASVDVELPLDDGREMKLRCVVRPDEAQAALLDRLGLELPRRLRQPLPAKM